MSLPYFTLADLERGLSGLGPPARLAVFGDPVAHSRSPQMHNPALKECGIDAQYIRLHIKPEEFLPAVRFCRDLKFFGINCTIPHKLAALRAVDHVDELARRLGAVNTIVFGPDKTSGFNSDGPGLLRALREEFDVGVENLRILILGAGGGAGRAAAIQCALANCPHLTLVNRTRHKIEALAEELATFYPRRRVALEDAPDLTEIDLVINASSVGMKPDDPEGIPRGAIRWNHLVYDMIYSPPLTPMLQDARGAGAKAANGLSMLLHQGVVSFEHWFPHLAAPTDVMRRGLMESLKAE